MAKCVNTYSLPLKQSDVSGFHQGQSFSHAGKFKHSIDFGCPEGTLVYAALGGVVTFVEDSFSVGGLDKKYWDMGNRIVIKHENNEYTAYEHLQYKGSLVTVGLSVESGMQIGISGNTGFTTGPHVHFEVFHKPDKQESEGTTLEVTFSALE